MRKPHSSLGWLIASVLVLTAGTIVLVLVPVRTCPLCLSMGNRPVKKVHLVLAMPPNVFLNCPTCDDEGKVTILRAWRSPTLAPQVVELLKVQDKGFGRDLDVALESIVVAGGRDPQDVLGKRHFKMQSPEGEARFVPGEERGRLLVLLRCGPSETSSVNLVLLGPDGVVLDVLVATCVSSRARMAATIFPSSAPVGADALVSILESTGVPSLVWWYDEGGRIPEGRVPEPYRADPGLQQYLIGVEGDRFKIIPSAAPPAGP